jgi:hypothetical protein
MASPFEDSAPGAPGDGTNREAGTLERLRGDAGIIPLAAARRKLSR